MAVAALAYGLAEVAGNATESDAQATAVEGASLLGAVGGRIPTLTPALMERGLNQGELRRVDEAVAEGRAEGVLTGLLLVNREGRIIYSEHDPLIGTYPPLQPELRAALRGDTVSGEDSSPNEPVQGRSLAAYLPLRQGDQDFGALEVELPLAPITEQVADNRRAYYLVVGAAGFLLWLALLPLIIRLAGLVQENYQPGRRRAVRELRQGIELRHLEVHYQPIVEVETGKLRGVEALVRWRRGRELVPPGEFLPLAEQSRLIESLTDYVLDAALAEASRCRKKGRVLPVSVNVSAQSIFDPSLPGRIKAALSRHGVPARLLCVEITETALIEDEAGAVACLSRISEMGVELSLDDFGTGYSSLTRLSRLPVSELKVDRSFVSNFKLEQRPLLQSIIQMGHALGLRVVAEGVEDRDTLLVLQELGCELAQGYYFSPALPAPEFERWRTAAPGHSGAAA